MLPVKEIEAYYGHVHALKKISLAVKKGEIVTLIGANGAGKSTTRNTISGLVRISSGEVRFFDQRMDRLPPHKILSLGIAQIPEGRRIFPDMSSVKRAYLGYRQRHYSSPDILLGG